MMGPARNAARSRPAPPLDLGGACGALISYRARVAERALVPLPEGGALFECPRWREGRWGVSDFSREAVYIVTTVDVAYAGLP
jgi:hypothetical protein